MRKRKERVEKWREEQRKKAMENIGELKKELEEMKQGKKWSLEDDDGQRDMFFCILHLFSNHKSHVSDHISF